MSLINTNIFYLNYLSESPYSKPVCDSLLIQAHFLNRRSFLSKTIILVRRMQYISTTFSDHSKTYQVITAGINDCYILLNFITS